MPGNIPNTCYAMIIGAMKCATTFLYKYLSQHPEICPAVRKEPEFFSENQDYGMDVERYEDIFSFDPEVYEYALEGSTGYTKYPEEKNVPKNIYEYGIHPKLIYSVRNPFDRIVSQHHFSKREPHWKVLEVTSSYAINLSNYYLQLEQYREYFPQVDILIVDFDRIQRSPQKVLNNIYQFLGIKMGSYPESFEVKNKTPLKSDYENVIKRHFKERFRRYVPQEIKNIGLKFIEKIAPPKKKILTVKERDVIYRALKDDMKKLQEVYNVDVSKWGF